MSLVYPYLYGTNIEGAGLGSVATLTNGSRVVTGLGGAWESALEWGDDISAGGAFAIIQEVVSDTELLLATEWAGPSQVNGPYVVRRGIANADPRNYGRKVAEYLATLRGLPDDIGKAVIGPDGEVADSSMVLFADTGGRLAKAGGPPLRLDSAQALTAEQQGRGLANIGAGVLSGFRNKIINGDFEIHQRGTGAVSGSSQFGADRWLLIPSAGARP